MTKLSDLGFSKGIIFETIVSTYNKDGVSNAAPLGIVMQNPQAISLSVYNSSQTSSNLRRNKWAVINLTGDIEFFYKTAFKDANPNGKLPESWFEKTSNAPSLRLADATIVVSVLDMVAAGSEKTQFLCKVERVVVAKKFPQAYSRAMSATLEAIVHGTRVREFSKIEEKKKQVKELLVLIEDCKNVVEHTAPSSVYSAVMSDLIKRIGDQS